VGLVAVVGASVRLHLGEVGVRLVAVELEFGLDAEDDPSAGDQLLELRRPAVVDIARGVLADVGVIDVQVHQDARLEARFGRFGRTQCITDHFLRRRGHGHLLRLVEQNLRLIQ
jgi:hypothetical protein